MPTVSVVVPNYNHAQYLPQRIESILSQTYQDFELILLDDCSTDDSCAVLSRYASNPRVKISFNETNSGSTFKQWNKGVRLSQGEYVWIAESDDYADPQLLDRLVALLDADPAVVFAFCRSRLVNADGRVNGFGDWHLDSLHANLWKADFCADGTQLCRSYFTRSPVVSNASAAVFRKRAYDAAGGADESYRLCGDWKLWASLAFNGKVAYVSEPLNYFRFHGGTVRHAAHRDGQGIIERLKVMRWVMDRAEPDASDMRKARREAARFWVPEVMSRRLSAESKAAIMTQVRTVDPHPWRRMPGPFWETWRRKFLRHWRS